MTVDMLGRALSAYRRTSTSRSAILLIVANLVPLAGVLFFGWSLWTILVLYWIENGIVGFWNVPKILLAQGAQGAQAAQAAAMPAPGADRGVRVYGKPVDGAGGRAGLAIFFVMHYGIFWFVHGVFVFMLPLFLGLNPTCGGPAFPGGAPDAFPGALDFMNSCTGSFGEVVWPNVVIAAVALFISHGASFLFNYIGRAEYLTASPMRQMGAPYGRVVILHLTILFGAFVVAFLGAPIGALLILVVLKTAFDLGLHLRERRAAGARIPADTTYGRAIREG